MAWNQYFKFEFVLTCLFSVAWAVQLFVVPDKQNRGGMVAINYYDVLVILFSFAAILFLILGIIQFYAHWIRILSFVLSGIIMLALIFLSYEFTMFRLVNICLIFALGFAVFIYSIGPLKTGID